MIYGGEVSCTIALSSTQLSSAGPIHEPLHSAQGADGCYMSDMWQLSLVTRNWTELSENVPCQKRCMSKQGQR